MRKILNNEWALRALLFLVLLSGTVLVARKSAISWVQNHYPEESLRALLPRTAALESATGNLAAELDELKLEGGAEN